MPRKKKHLNPTIPKATLLIVAVFGLAVVVTLISILLNEQSSVTQDRNQLLLEKAPQLQSLPTDLEKQEVIQAIAQAGTLEDCEYAQGLVINGVDYYAVCKNNVSFKNKSFASCQLVDEELISQDDCINQAILELANSGSSVEACSSAPTPEIQNKCIYTMRLSAAIADESPASCQKLSSLDDQNNCRDDFWKHTLFELRQNVSCDQFISESLSQSCSLSNDVIDQPETTIHDCDAIEDPQFSNFCVEEIRRQS